MIATSLLLIAAGVAILYLVRGREAESHPISFGMTHFCEPGSGRWMSLKHDEWHALSDSGGAGYPGGPWRNPSTALAALQNNKEFMEEYMLAREDIAVPTWRPREQSWDNDWGCCNILCSRHLYEFWERNDSEALEYR